MNNEHVNPVATYHLRLAGRRTFMNLVEDIRDNLCPALPGVQSLETGGYSFFNGETMNYIVHYVEPACQRHCETVRAVRLTTREDPKRIEDLAEEIHAQIVR